MKLLCNVYPGSEKPFIAFSIAFQELIIFHLVQVDAQLELNGFVAQFPSSVHSANKPEVFQPFIGFGEAGSRSGSVAVKVCCVEILVRFDLVSTEVSCLAEEEKKCPLDGWKFR